MTIGAEEPGFCSRRLRVARAFKGFTQKSLADKAGVGQQFIARLENGSKEPNSLLAKALGDALGFDPTFFYGEPLDEFHDSECAFRRRASTQISVRARALACGTLFGQMVEFLNNYVHFPVHNVPEINAATDQQIEEAAEHCRAQWRLARDLPIANILRVAESAGVPVAKFTDIGEKVDSFSRAGSPCVIVLTDKAASRCRYDVAHELGHLVLHRGKTTGTKETEAQANRFAAALLLPAHRFLGEFPRHLSGFWDSMFRLKTRWRVSLGAMIRRASEYNVIGPTHYTRLYKELSVRGWLRHEPCEFDAEQPEILPFALETVKQAQGLSLDNVRTALAWKPDTFEQLTGIAIHREEPPRRAKIIQLRSS